MANRLDGLWQIVGNNGEVWDPFITRIAGIGLPPASRVVAKTPTQDGSAELGFVLEDREVLVGLMWHCHGTLAAARRRKPYKVLGYLNSPVTIRRTLDDQSRIELRQCVYNGGMELDSAQAFDGAEYAGVSLICRDPAWYGDSHAITVEYEDMAHAVYGDSAQLTSAEGLYTDGDWYAYPTISILGPCNYFDLQSATTEQRLRYYREVVAGETVTICTNPHPAYLSAQSSVQGQVRNYIYPGDDFGGFCLWPDPKAAAGCNVWEIDTAGMDARSSLTFAWEDRWQGA